MLLRNNYDDIYYMKLLIVKPSQTSPTIHVQVKIIFNVINKLINYIFILICAHLDIKLLNEKNIYYKLCIYILYNILELTKLSELNIL